MKKKKNSINLLSKVVNSTVVYKCYTNVVTMTLFIYTSILFSLFVNLNFQVNVSHGCPLHLFFFNQVLEFNVHV